MASEERLKLFRGKPVDIQQLEQTNVIRIFVSSTFSDMLVERDLLVEKVYPTLRKFCQEVGLEFQVMDMRWGIQDAANVDHSTCELCLQEIKTCKRLSVGPYLVAFIGNRYGYRPIQSNLSLPCFEKFTEIAGSNGIENAHLLQEWYRRDDNAIPPCYILQPITSKYLFYDDENPENAERRISDRRKWQEVSNKLCLVLRHCAKVAMEEGNFSEDLGMQFYKSVTALEIEEGLLTKDAVKPVFVYRREITDIDEHVDEPSATKFVDVRGEGRMDDEAQTLLQNFKTEIDGLIGASGNIRTYQIKWQSEQGVSASHKSHHNYLEKFCKDFLSDLKNSISQAVGQTSHKEEVAAANVTSGDDVIPDQDWLFEEVAHQASFAKRKSESFCGRKELIENVLQKLLKGDDFHPVTVFGTSGKGKTALMSKLVQCCREKDEDNVMVYRFLGTSPNSTHIHNVLQTLVLQISEVFDLPSPDSHLLQSFNSVVEMFSKLLKDVSNIIQNDANNSDRNLIIILDSLDQLTQLDGAHRLHWLPKRLPTRVKILLSTIPDPDLGILENLRQSFPVETFLEVTNLDEETGKEILESWLEKEKRTVTPPQKDLVMNSFRSCPTPLFMKLIFDEARSWYSYTDVSAVKMASSSKEAISMFFDRLEKVHGKIFVSKAIGYIVATKNGVTESELEDLLSLDDEALDNCYSHWSPPSKKIVRIPSLLWTRLKYDLGGDLVERQAAGHTVLALYHRQFVEVARERYLEDSDFRSIHHSLAHYFLGTWSDGKNKPLKLKIWKNKIVKCDRQVASQPCKFSDKVFNFRKLDELPFHLIHAGLWKTLCDEVLCNASWMMNKIQAFSIKDVLDDYSMALKVENDSGITLIRDALKLAKPTLEFSGGIRNHLCCELYARLEYFKDHFRPTVGKIVQESLEILENTTAASLIPLTGCFEPPGGPLRTTLTGFRQPISAMTAPENESILVAGSREGLIKAWKIGIDEPIYTVKAHDAEVKCIAISGSRLVSGSFDNTLQVMNIDTESQVAFLKEDHTDYKIHGSVAISKDGNVVISACGRKTNVWDVGSLQRKCTFQTEKNEAISCDVMITRDQNVIVGYRTGRVVCWSVETEAKLYEIDDHGRETTKSSVEDDGSAVNPVLKLYLREDTCFVHWNSGRLAITDAATGSLLSSLNLNACGVLAVSPKRDAFAVSHGSKVFVWKRTENGNFQEFGCLSYHHADISSMKFESSGQSLVVGSRDEEITVWSMSKLSSAGSTSPSDVIRGMGSSVEHLVVVKNVIISASSKVFYIKLWNLNRRKIAPDPKRFRLQLNNNDISSCGRFLAFYDNNFKGEVTYLDLRSSSTTSVKVLHEEEEVVDNSFTSLCFPKTSSYVLCSTNSGRLHKCLNKFISKKKTEKPWIESITLSSSAHEAITVLGKSTEENYAAAVCQNRQSDRQTIIFIDSFRMSVLCRTTAEKQSISGHITAICVGKLGSNACHAFVGTNNSMIHVLLLQKNIDDGARIAYSCSKVAVLSDHESQITTLALSYDQQFLFSGSLSKTRRLWKLKEDKWDVHREIFFKSLLDAGTTTATFSRDGKYVVSGSHERSIKVWSVETGNLVAAQYVYATVTGLCVTDDHHILATTKMGYVIIDKLHLPATIDSREQSEASQRISSRVIRRRSSERNSSTTCNIV